MLMLLLVACLGPTSGTYDFVVVGEASDCPESYSEGRDPEGPQTLLVRGDELVLAGDPDVICALDGFSFQCPFTEIDATQDYSDQGRDAVFLVDAEMDGEWITSTTVAGTMSIETTCEGDDCAEMAELGAPECLMSWDFTGER